ncbi:hypothetical protein CapIbe_000620 [Capra ibex]
MGGTSRDLRVDQFCTHFTSTNPELGNHYVASNLLDTEDTKGQVSAFGSEVLFGDRQANRPQTFCGTLQNSRPLCPWNFVTQTTVTEGPGSLALWFLSTPHSSASRTLGPERSTQSLKW